VILDATAAGERFSRGRVLAHVIYKSLVYTVMVALVVAAEHGYHAYRKAGSWAGARDDLVTPERVRHMAFTVVCVFLVFIAYNLFSEVDRRLGGKGALRAFLTSRREEHPS
jgi:hypothetical protein